MTGRGRTGVRTRARVRRRRAAYVVGVLLVVVPGGTAFVVLDHLAPWATEPREGAAGATASPGVAASASPASPSPASPSPAAPSPAAPSTAAPTDLSPPDAPDPDAPDPGAPEPDAPGPDAPGPHAPVPVVPEPPLRTEDVDSAASLTVVVNKRRPLDPIEYRPDDLVPVGGSSVVMRAEAAAALAELRAAAQRDGSPVAVHSATRSYVEQRRTFEGWVAQLGRDGAERASARAGYSEHQTGLAVDVVALGDPCGVMGCFGSTDAGAWVAANAYRFGFVVRYRAEHEAWTGYKAEPWHLRYVGPQVAADVHAAGDPSLEEFFGLEPAPGYAG